MPARSLVSPLGALVALAACGGGTPAPSTAPSPADAPPTAGAATAAATAGPSRFTWSAGRRTVEVHTDAVVTRDVPTPGTAAGPAASAAPPAADQRVTTVAYVTADLAPADAPGTVAVTGTVDSLVAAAPAPTTLVAGLRYRAASDARGVRVEAADPAVDLRCTAPTGAAALSALGAVRETLPRIPAGLAAGASWRDTSVTASCAGPVLLVAQTVARYESAADPAAPGRLRVTRQTTTTARGTGTAGVRPLAVAASGTARAVYALDPARGQLVDGTSEGRAAVTITVAGVAQRFTQQTRTQLTVR